MYHSSKPKEPQRTIQHCSPWPVFCFLVSELVKRTARKIPLTDEKMTGPKFPTILFVATFLTIIGLSWLSWHSQSRAVLILPAPINKDSVSRVEQAAEEFNSTNIQAKYAENHRKCNN